MKDIVAGVLAITLTIGLIYALLPLYTLAGDGVVYLFEYIINFWK